MNCVPSISNEALPSFCGPRRINVTMFPNSHNPFEYARCLLADAPPSGYLSDERITIFKGFFMIKRYCNESDDYYETKMLTKNHPKTKEAYTEVVYNSNPLPKQFSYWKTGFAFYRYPQTGCSYAFQGQSSALKIFIEHLLIRHFQILS